ncbi:MAG TPA: gliding motility-associated protein GldE [Saprospiraceae bacterium]|nr:gliding motility-associated protein GldE [Saprospiraceae bacterium]HMQ81541.1 gliding motility-associated protein GldE [Saprospiraceae bacterium]
MEPEADPFLFIFQSVVPLLLAIPPDAILGVLTIVSLIVCSALISGSEVAYFSLSPNDIEKLEQENTPVSKRILKLRQKPRKLLATILISNNFVNIAIVILSDFVLVRLLPEATFKQWGESLIGLLGVANTPENVAYYAWLASFLITVVGVTFLLVLFGEVAPKVYAKINNLPIARLMSGPLDALNRFFSPVSMLMVGWSSSIEKRLARKTQSTGNIIKDDIHDAIDLAVIQEDDHIQEVDILKSIVKFGDVTVKQIMRSRVDVVAVDFRIDYHQLLEIVKESGYSRIPVYENDFDHVTGILYVKDLLGHLHENKDFEWQGLIRTDVHYTPEAKRIQELLKEFQRHHLHMAVVVDEYGGSSGIVTLEDIMEEVIGEIKDEFDLESEVEYKKLAENEFLFEGKTLLNDVCRVIGVSTSAFDEVRGEADSLAGLILELTGRIPKKDLEVTFNNYRFKVVAVNVRRIEQVLVTIQ